MFKNVNPTVVSETKYIASVTVILSTVLQSVFLIIGMWNYKVLLGNIYSGFFVILNFYLMGMSVAKAVDKDEKEARNVMKTSMSLRGLMLFAAVAVGVLIPLFDIFAVLIPFFFVRIAVFLRPFIKKEITEKGERNE